ncbi:P-loop NTPase fold protein, partial [Brevundimonas sp.]|uniref:KAP family P-loop NTPase fold protein n=2 Tax=Brevundimonas TaxID=41275 RepID=UPI00289F4DDC
MTTAPFAIDRQPETRTLDGDRPLLRSQDDRLGFSQVAAALSRAILNQAAPEGLVIGVEGDWGSGKSSLLRLTLEQLAQGGAKRPPAVIEFRPWLIGDRDALLQALFSEFANALERLGAEEAGPARGKLSAAEAAGKELRAFAARLGGVGKLVKLGGDFVPGLGAIGSGLVAVSEVAADVKAPSLVELKTRIDGLLRDLQRTIVVTIDDVDRLEPSEALELLRLVRSVADFPHVVYLLCYDRHVLSAGIETSARVPDGEAFLEKILQVTVEVPLPEAYRLRTWFQAGLAALM